MAFTIKMTKCKTCGRLHVVPGGKFAGMGYDDCPECREAKAAQKEADHD